MIKSSSNKIYLFFLLGRYHKPYGSFLLMWPCFWGVSFLNQISLVDLWYLILLAFGSFIMRGAGCTINDIVDHKYDAKVERTKNRPIASKKITILEAIFFLFIQLLLGLVILINFDNRTILISLSIIPLVFLYPLFKRFTFFPQVILGLIFNWGALVGFSSSNEFININIIYLYFAGVLLTIGYDTIYAFQDINDDRKIGLKSLAIKTSKFPRFYLGLIYGFSTLLFCISFFKNYGINFLSIFFSSFIFLFLLMQVKNFDINNKQMLQKQFVSNSYLGGFIFFGFFIANYL